MHVNIIRTFVVAFLCAHFPINCHADELWKLIAQSHSIVVGNMSPPAQAITQAQSTKKYDYLNIPVKVSACIKGKQCQQHTNISYYTQPASYSPNPNTLLSVDSKSAILFLTQVDEGNNEEKQYFAGYTPKALQVHSQDLENAVRLEVARQAEVPNLLASLYDTRKDPIFKRVKNLINKITIKNGQEKAFAELEKLGMKAVPAMINLMDDRRRLANPEISLRNSNPNATEGIRHYEAELVVDAVAAILNQITSENFGSIYNGGTERERSLAIVAWRVYMYHLLTQNHSIN